MPNVKKSKVAKLIIAKTKNELENALDSKKDSIILQRLQNLDSITNIKKSSKNDNIESCLGSKNMDSKFMDSKDSKRDSNKDSKGAINSNIHNLDSIKAINNITIGLSPTMGALHNGHKSLIQANVSENDISIVSIFVNPTQFSAGEDLANYPRTIESDLKMCESLGVDIVFLPEISEIYEVDFLQDSKKNSKVDFKIDSKENLKGNSKTDSKENVKTNSKDSKTDSKSNKKNKNPFESDEITLNPPKKMGYILEGFYRPTHFAGVIQVVLKLLNLTQANNAYFGKKDAQQLLIIQKMARDLRLKTRIIPIDIVRDSDTLALSSRNVYLDSKTRQKALAIPKTIFHIESLIKKNVRDIGTLKREALAILSGLDIDYMDFFTHNLSLAKEAKNCIFLIAVRFKLPQNSHKNAPKEVRLLDNLWIE
ncbi:4-phosphopantoate--beta-alanine ligase [Helicobacter saguini]|uniref:Pantothenate synthetase n=1 Tax=Helicobacter saguini TaxID=1548018 RepID=A0A347VW39_9HELI|nr:pantoate--beta-alanine ligase [Helicobacter saguini]MWV62179.1 4-phosphopantoate--beta-alanine ligase [Helicobacter saguini]MWV67148.1 4-phosphopantoate--beta-alanine ligase [Helicobacter saguini]MWV69500.1 4-phosphopantoate--beta-alanine ligase [Helicobacter saguini]MWV70949.1 4-phosphopantoate--beta-alanine ligase [Helicobacter saguini]TLD92518.1 4-phosphopantoate--beta-alanine ligase [Helicobacter saguini]